MMIANKLLVCLDLSEYDSACINQAIVFASKFDDIEEVTLLHNIRFDFLQALPNFEKVDFEKLKEKIKNKIVQNHIEPLRKQVKKIEVNVTTNQNTLDTIQKYLTPTTLTIMGLKKREDGVGIIPQQLLNLESLASPVLLCPKNIGKEQKGLLIATNLSESMHRLFKFGTQVSNTLQIEMTALHIHKIPLAYFPYLNFKNDELNESIRKKAQIQFHDFLKNQPRLAERLKFKLLFGNNIAHSILNFFHEGNFQLMLINKKEIKKSSKNKLGSTIKRLLHANIKAPILVI